MKSRIEYGVLWCVNAQNRSAGSYADKIDGIMQGSQFTEPVDRGFNLRSNDGGLREFQTAMDNPMTHQIDFPRPPQDCKVALPETADKSMDLVRQRRVSANGNLFLALAGGYLCQKIIVRLARRR